MTNWNRNSRTFNLPRTRPSRRRNRFNQDPIRFTNQINPMTIKDCIEKIIRTGRYNNKVESFPQIPNDLFNLTQKIMRNPVNIIVKTEMLTLEGIKQHYVNLDNDNEKYRTLKDLFESFSVSQCIIYCNSVKRVQDLYDAMKADGYPVCQIHSSLEKNERLKNYKEFREGNQRVLISSNVTARGIDVQQVSTVINFDIPKSKETYLHRIGRSGRWGRKGVAINFITRRDISLLKDIESFYSTEISELPSNFA